MARRSSATTEKEQLQAEKSESTVFPAYTKRGRAAEKAEAAIEAKTSGDTVAVALNRPTGVIFKMPDGRKVEIKGNGAPLIGKDTGILPVGAYQITMVAKSDWEYICKNFSGMALFKNGLLFAANRKSEAEAEGDSRDDLRNGFEPVDIRSTKTSEAVRD